MARDARHPGRETLRRFLFAELPGSAAKAVVRHLLRGCERCHQRLTAMAALFQPGLAAAPGTGREYGRPITKALHRARASVEVRTESRKITPEIKRP